MTSITVDQGILLVALGAIAISWLTYKRNQVFQNEARARDTWLKFFRFAFENPQFAMAKLPDGRSVNDCPELIEIIPLITNLDCNQEKYEWFVAELLFSCEQVVRLSSSTSYWDRAIKDALSIHKDYIRGLRFKTYYLPHYSSKMQVCLSTVGSE